jgi:fibronectin-binding autotransporter adhesin
MRHHVSQPNCVSRSRRSRACFLALEFMEQRTLLSAVSWTGAVSNDWDTPANWSDDAVPGAGDDVTIALGTGVVHSTGAVDSINSLTSTVPLSITSGSLTIAAASTTTSSVSIDGGTLTTNGDLSIGGTLSVSSGTLALGSSPTISVSGALSLGPATISGAGALDGNGGVAIATASGGQVVMDGTTLNNSAGQSGTFAGNITMEDGATLNNVGTLTAVGGSFSISQGAGAAATFDNEGTFVCSTAGAGVFTPISVAFDDHGGTVSVEQGQLQILGGVTSAGGTFTVASDSVLDFGGDGTFDAASTIDGAGDVYFGYLPGTTTVNGTYNVTGTTGSGGTLDFDGQITSLGERLEIYPGTVNLLSPLSSQGEVIGNLQVGPTAVFNLGSNDLNVNYIDDDGTVSGTGTITVSGMLFLDEGTFAGSGIVDADGGIEMYGEESPGQFTLDGYTLNNAAGQTAVLFGVLNFTNGAVLNNYGTLGDPGGAEEYEEPSAELDFSGSPPGASAFSDYGGVTDEFSSFSVSGVAFNVNGGSVNVEQGLLSIQSGGSTVNGSFTVASGATLQLGDGGTMPYAFDAKSTVTGAGNLEKDDGTTLVYAAKSTLTGSTTIGAGDFQVDGSQPASPVSLSPVDPSSPVTLSGTGAVGPVTSSSSIISPGDGATATGILTVQGSVALDSRSKFVVALDGASAVDDFDQLNAVGAVNLGNSTLDVTLGFKPAPGESFPVITSTFPIAGTFDGLREGASFTVDGTPFTISYKGDSVVLTAGGGGTPAANGGPAPSAPPSVPALTDGPEITSVQRFGYHMMPTRLVLTFDQALDAVTALDVKDYRIIGVAGRTIAVKKAMYDPAALTVTLYPVRRLSVHHGYKLIVDGTSPHGLTNTRGQLLDGTDSGSPDSDYRTTLTWRNVVFDPPWPRPSRSRSHSNHDLSQTQ